MSLSGSEPMRQRPASSRCSLGVAGRLVTRTMAPRNRGCGPEPITAVPPADMAVPLGDDASPAPAGPPTGAGAARPGTRSLAIDGIWGGRDRVHAGARSLHALAVDRGACRLSDGARPASAPLAGERSGAPSA